ncbi:CLUMA_CG001650, isoform A [Clunio marinus]|uniref:CLUMA_CG001650, isoform A n=1 Tax=Clunio marinus TaxID=568069 RepID=A0A1J1HIJ6_9DIPT|nr:CLUMA_CG001650, isoform A [Clunio marinus]
MQINKKKEERLKFDKKMKFLLLFIIIVLVLTSLSHASNGPLDNHLLSTRLLEKDLLKLK